MRVVSWTPQAGLGGTKTSLGRSGPWYLALQVCPVLFGSSQRHPPSAPAGRAMGPPAPGPGSESLEPSGPLWWGFTFSLENCTSPPPRLASFSLCTVQSCSL